MFRAADDVETENDDATSGSKRADNFMPISYNAWKCSGKLASEGCSVVDGVGPQ